jgi:hypothetical protein
MAHRFEDYPESAIRPWLDRPDAEEEISRRRERGEIDAERAAAAAKWSKEGYLVLRGALDGTTADAINADVQAILDAHPGEPPHTFKEEFQNLFPRSEATRRAMTNATVLRWVDFLLGMRAIPYQTLNLPFSSQQGDHSDAILMTTHPPGFLVAAWFALEDIADDSGPLRIRPGSHRIPYVGAREVGIPREASEADCGRVYDANYYGIISRLVAERGLPETTFLGRKGDVLLWHSNLLHGAQLTKRAGATRRSLIVHYFGEYSEPYSDLFHRKCDVPQLR